jgi:hypothetical protein
MSQNFMQIGKQGVDYLSRIVGEELKEVADCHEDDLAVGRVHVIALADAVTHAVANL